MPLYQNFIGIDIGKFNFVTSHYGEKPTKEYENNSIGITEFIKDNKDVLSNSLCIAETTGGYELSLLYSLCQKGYKVHRANTRKVKNFIRSFGNKAKTDILDAKALAKYGYERHQELELFKESSKESIELFNLVQRRLDLKQMLVAEKNRKQKAGITKLVSQSCETIIKTIKSEVEDITKEINKIIESSTELKSKSDILKTIPGIGDIVAFELLILLPELGSLNRREIASLAGVAPVANDSGRQQGYRRTGHGRAEIKPILFLSAMSARNSKTEFKEFYLKLINKGKQKMVALTALMRKIIVIANAKLRDLARSTTATTTIKI